jgi:serine/threonine-protein kinase
MAETIDLLTEIQKAGILTDRALAELREQAAKNDFPTDLQGLAQRLISEKILTPFMAKRLIAGRGRELVVSRYVILDRLGKGSMGEVFKAQHILMGRLVALKRIASDITSKDKAVARFQREMRLVGRLDHPNVVRAYDADARGQLLYLVMEYVKGKSLQDILKTDGPLPIELAIRYAIQAARGLHHAHEQGVVHRDVKPSNLFVTEDGETIKILDLGLGALMEDDPNSTFQTADNIAVGTIDYMSPEQAMGKDVDGRSDQFNLGVTMYYLLTAKFPFPGNNPMERLSRRITGRPAPILEHRPEIPTELVAILDKMMATKAHDRFPSCGAVADALERLLTKDKATGAASSDHQTKPPTGSNADPGFAPGQAKVRTVRPNYPGWFDWLAALVEKSPAGGFVVVLFILALVAALGAISVLAFHQFSG